MHSCKNHKLTLKFTDKNIGSETKHTLVFRNSGILQSSCPRVRYTSWAPTCNVVAYSTCTSRRKPVSFPNHVRMRQQTKPARIEHGNGTISLKIQEYKNEAVWQGSEENIYNSQQCQKSASRVNTCSFVSDMTPLFWYSPTRFSKKFVFPSREMFSIKSNGFSTL